MVGLLLAVSPPLHRERRREVPGPPRPLRGRTEGMDRREFLAAAAAPLMLGAAARVRPADRRDAARARHRRPRVERRRGRRLDRPRRSAGSPRRPIRAASRAIGGVGALVAHTAGGRMTLIDSDLARPPDRAARSARRATPPSPPTGASRTSPTRRGRRSSSSTCAAAASSGGFRVGGPCPPPRHRPCSARGSGSRSAARRASSRSLSPRRAAPAAGRRHGPAAVPRPRRRLHARRRAASG